MSVLFIFLKVFPFIGIPVTLILFDLAKSLRQKGNKSYIGVGIFAGLTGLSVLLWFIFRGDLNSDSWFRSLTE